MPRDEWRKRTIGDLVTLQRGIDLPDAERRAGSTPIMGSFGITGWHDRPACKGPGVTVGRSGASIGVVSYVNQDYWPLNTCLYVRNFHNNNPRFVYYFLKTLDLARLNSGSAQPSLNRNFVHPVPVEFPDPSEQEAIASVLGAHDDKIDLNRRMNETLEAMARAIFKDWFVDFGPTRAKMEGRAPYLAPELWSLFPDRLDDDGKPEGWASVPANTMLDFNPPEPLQRGSICPYLDMSALPLFGSWPDAPVPREFASGSRFRNGDALLARITPCLENGKAAFIQNMPDGVVGWGSTEFIVLRACPPMPPAYAYLVARNTDFKDRAIQSMTGTSGRQRVQVDSLAAFAVTRPDHEVALAFGELISPLFVKIAANSRESETLAATRDLLLPKLMSGEIRVKDAEKIAEAAA